MTMLCATDFSAHAHEAATIAARVAARINEPLVLLHVVAPRGLADRAGAAWFDAVREQLEDEATRLHRLGAQVDAELQVGTPDEVIVAQAQHHQVRLVILAALGYRSADRWLLGSVAERVAQISPVPVLTVRSGEGLRHWVSGDRPLRVLVAVDRLLSDQAALRWAADLGGIAPCELVIGHVYFPPAEHRRLGLPAPSDLSRVDPEVEQSLVRELGATLDGMDDLSAAAVAVQPGMGRVADHIVELGQRERADLIVVGTHQRQGLDRLWHGSVSHVVAQLAGVSVACVPAPESAQRVHSAHPAHPARHILVPTDLSELGNRAIATAFAVAAPGSVVHLLHVVEPHDLAGPAARRISRQAEVAALRALVPAPAARPGVEADVEVVASRQVAKAICETAERFNADLLCLSSHGRSGLAAVLAGSVARAVAEHSNRALLLVRPERNAA